MLLDRVQIDQGSSAQASLAFHQQPWLALSSVFCVRGTAMLCFCFLSLSQRWTGPARHSKGQSQAYLILDQPCAGGLGIGRGQVGNLHSE